MQAIRKFISNWEEAAFWYVFFPVSMAVLLIGVFKFIFD